MVGRPVQVAVSILNSGIAVYNFTSLRGCVEYLTHQSKTVSIKHSNKQRLSFPKDVYDAIWSNLKNKESIEGFFIVDGKCNHYKILYLN